MDLKTRTAKYSDNKSKAKTLEKNHVSAIKWISKGGFLLTCTYLYDKNKWRIAQIFSPNIYAFRFSHVNFLLTSAR